MMKFEKLYKHICSLGLSNRFFIAISNDRFKPELGHNLITDSGNVILLKHQYDDMYEFRFFNFPLPRTHGNVAYEIVRFSPTSGVETIKKIMSELTSFERTILGVE